MKLPFALPLSVRAAIICAAFGSSLACGQTESVPLGARLTLFVTVDGHPAPTVEFFKGGVKLADGVNVGDATWHYVIASVTAADAGIYTAKATNSAGSATSDPYVITIATPPSKPVIRIAYRPASALTVEVPAGTKVITTPSPDSARPAAKK